MKTQTPKTVRAAIYLRISLDPEMDGLAIDRQREDCENLAKYKGWEVVETYVDQSISASDKHVKRPAYDRMVADYEAGLLDAIICYDLDRLTRQPRQIEDWIDAAELRGLALVTANGDADLSTDGGRMYARIKAAVARQEIERKSERQSRAQLQRAQQGRAPKGTRPVGYRTNGDVIEDEAKAVKAIYEAFLRGDSLRAIARALSGQDGEDVAEGVPTLPSHQRTLTIERNTRRIEADRQPKPVPPERPWNPSTVLSILRNPRYPGYAVYSKKKTRRQEASESRRKELKNNVLRDDNNEPIKGQWEPIIAEDTWWTVQNLLDDPDRVTNRSGSTVRKYIGAGLYRCDVCDQPVITRHIYYSCKNGHLNRTREAIDDYVKKIVVARLQRKDLNKRKKQADPSANDAYSKLIAEQNARIARAERDYDSEFIEGQDLARIRKSAREEINRLEAKRLSTGSGVSLRPILGVDDPAEAFLSATMPAQRTLIDTLMTVRLKKVGRGIKGFNPESVSIEWKQPE